MNVLANISRSKGDPMVLESGSSSLPPADRLAKNLGWFSIGLGLTEVFAAAAVTRFLGIEGREGLVRAFGAREISSGVLSLSVDKGTGLWSRVAGDCLDVMALLAARGDHNPQRDNVTLALVAVLGIAAVDVIAARHVSARHQRAGVSGNIAGYRDRSGFPRGRPTLDRRQSCPAAPSMTAGAR